MSLLRQSTQRARVRSRVAAIALALSAATAAPVMAQEKMYFPAVDNVTAVLVQRINAETVRIDMSAWYLTERAVTQALVNRFKAGVQVRLIGDRGSIFEIDPLTRSEFYWLASQGVPIRLRYNPTWYPEIVHWKATIFAGQNLVAFGSANYTPFELAPVSSTNYKDETVLLTDDREIVNAFKTQFDRMWNDTTREPSSRISSPPYFRDWNTACAAESACADYKTKYPNPAPMLINTARLEPDNPMPADMVWGQGSAFNNRLIQEINAELTSVDFVIYRLTVPSIADALLAKHQAGVPVRLIIEPSEYLNRKWPEFWLTHAYMDKLWAAGVPIKQRKHQGLTHMKMLVTSRVATNASSNLAAAWQRDHNYFVPALKKPGVYNAMKTRFQTMWDDTAGFTAFVPGPPDAASLASPVDAATAVSATPTLVWNRAAFAVSYDVYLGTSSSAMSLVANVPAQLVNDPPSTYSWTPTTPLQAGTTYYWRVVSRTFASKTAGSATRTFTTSGSGGGTPPPPGSGSTPYSGSAVVLPGRVQAENFDNGGADVAYRDTTAGNAGGAYRSTDVDIEASSDSGGGFNVGWLVPGEWMEYTVNVGTAGTYRIDLRVAANAAGGRVHVEFGGADKTGALTIPNTGGWQKWTTVSATAALAAGTQKMRLVVDAAGSGGVVGNINWIEIVSGAGPSEPPPATASEVVIYAAEVATVQGTWSKAPDATAAAGITLRNPDLGAAVVSSAQAAPANYVETTFNAVAGVRYRVWLRMRAQADSKWNDSVYVQFSGAVNSGGGAIYRTGTSSALTVNLWPCADCVSAGWGWQRNAYWLSDSGDVWFATTGPQTIRIQVREDGADVDQIVISPARYADNPPGPVKNDSTIVAK